MKLFQPRKAAFTADSRGAGTTAEDRTPDLFSRTMFYAELRADEEEDAFIGGETFFRILVDRSEKDDIGDVAEDLTNSGFSCCPIMMLIESCDIENDLLNGADGDGSVNDGHFEGCG